MNTRRIYDDSQTSTQIEYDRGMAQWVFDVPGPGNAPPFILDPHITLQQWGANACKNMTDIESSLKGYTQRLSKNDCLAPPELHAIPISYRINAETITDEPRATEPAWQIRNMENPHWDAPAPNRTILNDRMLGQVNVDSRELVKSNFRPLDI
jgi:hypothetical protein